MARTPILENIPIRVKHALHAREPNLWVICFKGNSVVKQGKDLQEFRGRDISTLATALAKSSVELISYNYFDSHSNCI